MVFDVNAIRRRGARLWGRVLDHLAKAGPVGVDRPKTLAQECPLGEVALGEAGPGECQASAIGGPAVTLDL